MNFASTSSSSSASGDGRAMVIGGDEAALRAFLAESTGMFGVMGETTVYIGQLPPAEVSLPIPLIPDVEISGSIVRGTDNVEILLRNRLPPEQTHEAYETLLLASGWQAVENMPMGMRGFVNTKRVMGRYCQKDEQASLMLHISEAEGNATSVRLNISREKHPCAPPGGGMGHNIYNLLPNLVTPSGVKLLPSSHTMSGGGNFGSRYASSSATLESDLSTAAIANAYNRQLDASGWERVFAEAGERSAVSSWMMAEDDGRLSLYFTLVADASNPDEYHVWLAVYEQEE